MTGLHISVCHLPPGTSKWNKIEHQLFSFISQNWRGKPLVSHEVIVNLISVTTTQTGLKVRAKLDTNAYPPGAKVSKKEIAEINTRPDSFHGEKPSHLISSVTAQLSSREAPSSGAKKLRGAKECTRQIHILLTLA